MNKDNWAKHNIKLLCEKGSPSNYSALKYSNRKILRIVVKIFINTKENESCCKDVSPGLLSKIGKIFYLFIHQFHSILSVILYLFHLKLIRMKVRVGSVLCFLKLKKAGFVTCPAGCLIPHFIK